MYTLIRFIPRREGVVRDNQHASWTTIQVFLFIVAHIGLGLAMNVVPLLAVLHAAVTVLIGFMLAGDASTRPERVVAIAAYITGAEVLWRMTSHIELPWELGKYAVIGITLVAVIRRMGPRPLVAPLLAFGLLLPSAALTISDMSLEEARQQISFNLSGPLALVMCIALFRSIDLSPLQLRKVLLCVVAPATAIAAIALFGILTNADLTFNTESNFATSGGFGPNQVSAILGLGAMCGFLSLCMGRATWPFRALMVTVVIWLATQSSLTFSRGGLVGAIAGTVVALFGLARDRGLRLRIAVLCFLLLAVGRYVIWPRLDAFTGGTITQRFTETDITRRDDLGWEDLQIFDQNLLLGVGPGRSSLGHDDDIITHTEFTRLLAEHGLLGATAAVMLCLAGIWNVRRADGPTARALALALMTWSCVFMLNSAMRTVAPAFVFGLAFAVTGQPSRAAMVTAIQQRFHSKAPQWVLTRG